MSSKKTFIDPYTGKQKSNRHQKHYRNQKKLKRIVDIYNGHWLCFAWKTDHEDGKNWYRRCYFSRRGGYVKKYCNKRVRHQKTDLENGLPYSGTDGGYKDINHHFRDWWL